MATNIIRRHLITYTQKQCRLWKIPLTPGVPSGQLWDRANRRWEETHTDMLVVDTRKLLLVPKSVVAFTLNYTPQRFHQHFVLNFLQAHHLSINSSLVKRRRPKKGRPGALYVTKKSIVESEAKFSKDYLTTFTQAHHEVFAQFKAANATQAPLENAELTRDDLNGVADRLIAALGAIQAGNDHAIHEGNAEKWDCLQEPSFVRKLAAVPVKLSESVPFNSKNNAFMIAHGVREHVLIRALQHEPKSFNPKA